VTVRHLLREVTVLRCLSAEPRQGIDVECHWRGFFGAPMRQLSKSYASLGCTIVCALAAPSGLSGQVTTSQGQVQPTCAGLLADNPGVSASGPNSQADSARIRNSPADSAGRRNALGDSARLRADSLARLSPDVSTSRNRAASFGIGGARSGEADIVLWVGVHADQVRFAKQPQTRVRLCWGGDSLRVVQRENIPSPVVAGTTYRNVYVAVELIGRVNAECVADLIGVRSSAQTSQPRAAVSNVSSASAQTGATAANAASASASNCAFLGGGAGAGAQTPRTPVP
jgi:hypothetical protein